MTWVRGLRRTGSGCAPGACASACASWMLVSPRCGDSLGGYDVSAKNAAILFSDIFIHLAAHGCHVGGLGGREGRVVLDRDEFARWLWARSSRFDFHPADMDCNEALEKLGLARRRPPDVEDDTAWEYEGEG